MSPSHTRHPRKSPGSGNPPSRNMSSEPSDQESYRACLEASEGADVDMDGIAVVVANVIVHLCLRIMVTWSPEDVDVGIQSLLVQIYTILLSTLLSLLSDSQKRLSVVDARFALWVSSSPLTVYTVVASISDLCGINTGLYKRIKSHRYIVRTLGASVLLLWTGLSMTAGLSSTAFKGSWCRVSTFPEWLLEVVMFHIFSLLYQGGSLGIPTITLLTPWVVFLVRRRSQLKMDIKLSSEGASKLHLPWTFLKCAWLTIDRNHKWCVYCLFTYCDALWGWRVIISAIDVSGWGYVLSYGQVSSLLFVVPILMSTVKLVYSYRLDLLRLLRCLPRACLAEALYLLIGKVPDPVARDSHLPFNITSYPEKPTPGRPRD